MTGCGGWRRAWLGRSSGKVDAVHGEELLDVRVGAGFDALDGAEVNDAAFEEDDDAVSDAAHEVEVVGDDDGSEPELAFEAEHEGGHAVAHDGIDHGGGLVVEDALGLGGEGTGDGDGAAVAGGEVGGEVVFVVGEVDHIEEPADDLPAVGLVVIFAELEGEEDVLADGEGIEEGAALEDHGDFAADEAEVGFGEVCDVLVSDDDAAGIGFEETHDVVEADALANTGAADDGEGLAGVRVKRAID